MKRTILLVMMMLPIMAMAQLPQFSKIVDKYNGTDDVTAMTIDKQMIAMFAGEHASFDFIDEIQILLSEDATTSQAIIKEAKKAVKKSKIEELISANDDGAKFTVYTKSNNDTYTHIVVIVENDEPSGFIVITGDIPQDKLNEVVKIANM